MRKKRGSSESVQEFLDNFTAPCPMTGCFLFTGATNEKGYGQLFRDGGYIAAHRYVLKKSKGLPEGLHALHSCSTPSCCNPDHLRVGTNHENMQDKMRAGRQKFVAADNKRNKTHCPKGHPYSGDNLWISKRTGARHCRTCHRLGVLASFNKNKEENNARRRERYHARKNG